MKGYFRNWNLLRVVYLALGIYVIVQGLLSEEYLWVLLGSFFLLMPIFNIGCYGGNDCSIPEPKNELKEEEITYEEIK